MARHAVRAGRPEPKAVIKAAPSEYERTHPVGSAERFLDQAAKEALALAAAGGIPPPSRFIPGAVRAVAKKAGGYPDPLLAEAAGLPAKELARRAANAEAYRKAMDAQNAVVDTVSLVTSPAGNMTANLLGAATHDVLTRQDAMGGNARLDNLGGGAAPPGNGSPGPDKDPYREMAIDQKLKRADELLKKYEGTDKYDAFKKRVDAMKHKYGVIAEVAPGAKWNYDEASQAVQRGLPAPRPSAQIAGSSTTPDYDSVIAENQNFLDWYSKRGWGSKFVGMLSGQNKKLANTAEQARYSIAYFEGMKNALGYAAANPERARALGTLVTPRQTLSDGSPRQFPTSFVWNENLGQYHIAHPEIRIKPGEPARKVRQDAKGGDATGPETAVSETPVSEAPVQQGGPRIVINPTTFHNKKDALCVAFNEGFRLWMEANDFQPQSEPTDAQRKFFSDTAYADDELQLRRTILARIATFDTSVKDPTDDQLSETASFLGAVLESDWCKNEWERNSVSRLMNAVRSAVGAEPAGKSR